jgi:hypothetical protein
MKYKNYICLLSILESMRYLVIFITLLTLVSKVSGAGISVTYQLSPNIVMPGDYADGVLQITNPSTADVTVNSVTFYGEGVVFFPRQIFNIGTIPPGATYTLPFSVKAVHEGYHGIEAIISTNEGIVIQNMELVVDTNFPSIVPLSPLYRGEVNDFRFYVTSPITLTDVKVIPLFDAKPSVVYIGTVSGEAEGSLKFIPNGSELRFKISFYSGRNYHEVVKTVPVTFLDSRGVLINFSSPYYSSYIGDCIELIVEISNLRNDDIYRISIRGYSQHGSLHGSMDIPKLSGGESRKLTLSYTPLEGGEDRVTVKVEYYDEFGNLFQEEAYVNFNVSEDLVLSLTNVEVSRELGTIRISGDISNNGKSEAYNVYVLASCGREVRDYFLGNIEPSDFQSFDLSVPCNGSANVAVKWTNKIGREFSFSEEVTPEKRSFQPVETEASSILYISIITAVVIFGIVGYVVYRHLKK